MERDYKSYSLKELLESLDSIDQESYPERVGKIEEETNKRKGGNENIATPNENMARREYGSSAQLVLFCLGIISFFLAGPVLTSGKVIGRREHFYSKVEDPVMFYLFTVFLLVAGISFFFISTIKEKTKVNQPQPISSDFGNI